MSKKMHGKGITRLMFVGTLVGLVLFALGGSALAAPPASPPAGSGNVGYVGDNGPTPPRLGDPVATLNEVQWITVGVAGVTTPRTLTFTLCVGDDTPGGTPTPCTAAIAYDAKGSAVASALGIAGMYAASGGLNVVGGPVSKNFNANNVPLGTWYYRVQWVGPYAGTNIPLLEVGSQPGSGVTVTVDNYQNGQTLPAIPNQPHGGYSAATDYCLQCHAVHKAGGEYVLMRQASVTATCATCHRLNGVAPAGIYTPTFAGVESLTSTRAAYEVAIADRGSEGHLLGWQTSALQPTIPFGNDTQITELGGETLPSSTTGIGVSSTATAAAGTSSAGSGGLYCGSCHTPHGDFGQLVNAKWYRTDVAGNSITTPIKWEEGKPIAVGSKGVYNPYYIWKDVDPTSADPEPAVWLKCANSTYTDSSRPQANIAAIDGVASPGLNCTYLTATDTEGESAYLYGYKLLSAYPNHTYGEGAESWGVAGGGNDNARWCGRCHDEVIPSEGAGGTFHNHPGSCTRCHGNPADGTSTDFPHTSTMPKLLTDYPDLLCVNCHSNLA